MYAIIPNGIHYHFFTLSESKQTYPNKRNYTNSSWWSYRLSFCPQHPIQRWVCNGMGKVAQWLHPVRGVNVSAQTVWRRLSEYGFHLFKPANTPLWIVSHIRARLVFAWEHKNWAEVNRERSVHRTNALFGGMDVKTSKEHGASDMRDMPPVIMPPISKYRGGSVMV